MAARGSHCLPHVWHTLAGSTKVLGRDEAAKKPPECAVVASAVAFMGPKWRRPPVFYFSSMMAADTEKLATDSSLSMHSAFVSACMVPVWSNSPLLIELNWSGELLNHAPDWGGNWLRRAKRG